MAAYNAAISFFGFNQAQSAPKVLVNSGDVVIHKLSNNTFS